MTFHRNESSDSSSKVKEEFRKLALANRSRQQNQESLSRLIIKRLKDLPEYAAASRLSIYLGTASEVQTLPLLPTAWSLGKRVAVPCCIGDHLDLFWIENLDELAPRTLGISEPKQSICQLRERRADLTTLDLIVVPGVAFDRRGGRLGHGKGYYDRLLRKARSDTLIVALAFECQVLSKIPMLDHDIFMDKILTERAVYQRRSGE